MQYQHLTSQAGTPHRGIELVDVDLATATDAQILELGRLLAEHLIVVAPGAHVTKERFWEICHRIGQIHGTARDHVARMDPDAASEELFGYFYHRNGRIHLPGMLRVSGIRGDDGHATGIFADGELGWHTNHAGQRHPVPNVGLQAVFGAEDSFTEILECVSPYAALSPEDRARVDALQITYKWVPYAVTRGGTAAQDEQFRHNQVTEGEVNHLVRESPGGLRGFHFSDHLIERFVGCDAEETAALRAFVRGCIQRDEYKYRHHWEAGDIVFFDQTVTLHRREGDISNRLLHRIAFGFDKVLPDEPEYATCGMVLEYANEEVTSLADNPPSDER